VTLALAASGQFPWRQVPAYLAAQLAGAVLGSFAIVGVLGDRASEVGLSVAAYGQNVGAGQAFIAEPVRTTSWHLWCLVDWTPTTNCATPAVPAISLAAMIAAREVTAMEVMSSQPGRYRGCRSRSLGDDVGARRMIPGTDQTGRPGSVSCALHSMASGVPFRLAGPTVAGGLAVACVCRVSGVRRVRPVRRVCRGRRGAWRRWWLWRGRCVSRQSTVTSRRRV
jgi:hypothetical protein